MSGRVFHQRSRRAAGVALALALVAGMFVTQAGSAGAVPPADCGPPDDVLVLTEDTRLDPRCTYTGGIEIVASGVTLNCAGARIVNDGAPGLAWGILIHAPVDQALSDVAVRNCVVEGFLNDVKITRDGFRSLPEGEEYEDTFSDIVLHHNEFRDSRGVGVFVDGYVTGVTIRDNLVTGTGSSGIYLETGSVGTRVLRNRIVDNGFRENGPDGQGVQFAGLDVWFWGVGREGVAIDGSRDNIIRSNYFEGNSVGGVLVYKNCGEYPEADRYFERRYGSHGNVIDRNWFVRGTNGVWVGSRMAENTLPMECTDPAYIDEPLRRVVLDQASGNAVRRNWFHDVTYAVRVEDDDTDVRSNLFTGAGGSHPVFVGTPLRTEVLDHPVTGTRLVRNESLVADTPDPYRWIHGHVETIERGNRAMRAPSALCEGPDIPRSPFIFVVGVAPWDPSGDPPTRPPDLELPVLGPLDACP